MLDYIRIGCAVPAVKVGDVATNTQNICAYMEKADQQKVDLLLFPELAMTGYSCGDLFYQEKLCQWVWEGLKTLLTCSAQYPDLTVVVGLPIDSRAGLLNGAAVIRGGVLQALTAKQHLPDYPGCEESRWFTPAEGEVSVCFDGEWYSVLPDTLFRVGDVCVGIEICEDFLAPIPPSAHLSLAGAEVICNLSASPEVAGKKAWRVRQIQAHSQRCKCVYAYCSAGYTESTADMVFSGHSLICENGALLEQSQGAADSDYLLVQDCDIGKIRADRRRDTTFRRCAMKQPECWQVQTGEGQTRSDGRLYPLNKLPFIPARKQERQEYCREIFQLQVTGLKQRLQAIGNANAVIGISGGLDSTLALLVAVEAMRQLGRPASDVYGVTMPCFGTSQRTYRNSWELMERLGIHSKEIGIKDAVNQHFADIGHDPAVHNGIFENSQARERTQVLMDYASIVGGIVVGTGDLSELALGWCTYNGDHMSMYGVNASIPKTLIRWIIDAVSQTETFASARAVLEDILDTPISPELLPPDEQGKISQQTEDLVGPYALHDFFLYQMLRYGFGPTKIYTMACRVFEGDFDSETVKKWLVSFYRRFFTQQFKRNCMPDGVRVGPLGLGPRGDWHMPSDASARLWLEEVQNL